MYDNGQRAGNHYHTLKHLNCVIIASGLAIISSDNNTLPV